MEYWDFMCSKMRFTWCVNIHRNHRTPTHQIHPIWRRRVTWKVSISTFFHWLIALFHPKKTYSILAVRWNRVKRPKHAQQQLDVHSILRMTLLSLLNFRHLTFNSPKKQRKNLYFHSRLFCKWMMKILMRRIESVGHVTMTWTARATKFEKQVWKWEVR